MREVQRVAKSPAPPPKASGVPMFETPQGSVGVVNPRGWIFTRVSLTDRLDIVYPHFNSAVEKRTAELGRAPTDAEKTELFKQAEAYAQTLLGPGEAYAGSSDDLYSSRSSNERGTLLFTWNRAGQGQEPTPQELTLEVQLPGAHKPSPVILDFPRELTSPDYPTRTGLLRDPKSGAVLATVEATFINHRGVKMFVTVKPATGPADRFD